MHLTIGLSGENEMGRLFRSIMYGSMKTRIYIILLMLALVGGVAAVAAGLIVSSLLPMVIGTVMLIAGGAMFIPLKSVLYDDLKKQDDKTADASQTKAQTKQGKPADSSDRIHEDAPEEGKEEAKQDKDKSDKSSKDQAHETGKLKGKKVGEVSVIHDPDSVPKITADEAKESLMNIRKQLFTEEGAAVGLNADELMSEIGKKKKRETKVFDTDASKNRQEGAAESASENAHVAEVDKKGFWSFKRKVDKSRLGKDGEYRGLAGADEPSDKKKAQDGRPAGSDRADRSGERDKLNKDVQPRSGKDPSRPSFYVGREQRVGIKRSERQKRINKEAEALRSGKVMTPESKRNGDLTDENDELIRGAEKRIDYLKTYTMSNVKKLMKEYKVSKDYVPVIIDRCRRYDVSRTPALCWKKGNDVNFLVFEASARVISVPYFDFRRVTYRHNVPEPELEAYDYIRKNMASYEMFEDVMPTFNVTGNKLGAMQYAKNLYVFGGMVEVPAASMRALNARFSLELKLFESLNLKGTYDEYFSDAYESKILWTDNVISQKAFQDRIRTTLQKMVDDDKLMWYDFNDDLTQMVRYKLVTDEYADYFRSRKQMR